MSSPLVLKSQLASVLGDSRSPCPIHARVHVLSVRDANGRPCSCSLAEILGGSIVGIRANQDYLAQVNVPSRPGKAINPLLVISLDGVTDTSLPDHLSGGYADVLSRPYLQTLMKYLFVQRTWCFVFYTSKSRDEGLKMLKELNLPTGGPEDDERDRRLGLFAEEDMRKWPGSRTPVMDLESLWITLYEEEGVRWGVHDTLVLTHKSQEMAKQPYNFIHVPSIEFDVSPEDDMFLLVMIGVLRDFESESNFAWYIKKLEFNKPDVWTLDDPKSTLESIELLYKAVRICAENRITIRAFTGNKRDRR
ncbi:hypothetical protein JCM5353_004022 [Sporobolomyces roseus]